MADSRPFTAGRVAEPQATWQPVNLRGQLPTNNEASYGTRDVQGIVGVTFHYTAGPSSQTAQQVAAYQTSEAARQQTGNGTPFPGLAYTLYVEASGRVVLAWGLQVRVWHSAAVINGKARNATHIGICYAGNSEPNQVQKVGLANAMRWCEQQLRRRLEAEGHGWVYSTSCPGPTSRAWVPEVVALAR